MSSSFARSIFFVVAVSVLVPATSCSSLVFAAAQQDARAARPGPVGPPPMLVPPDSVDARKTRDAFRDVLERHPPTLAQILKLDPSLLGNEAFLAGYPALAAFVQQHPEVRQTPSFYLEHVYVADAQPRDMQARMLSLWQDVLGGIAGLTVFLTVTLVLMWLIRTFLNYRRWNRVSRVQAEVHTKLLDRFTASDELLAYIQTPAGRRFLESAPIPLDDEEPRRVGAPLGRILSSIQAGVVIVALGLGFQFVSGRAPQEIGQVISLAGAILIALGLGFMVSAGVSYALSRRLGLLNPLAPPETPVERSTAG